MKRLRGRWKRLSWPVAGNSTFNTGASILNSDFLSSNICELRELHKLTVLSPLPDARSDSVG